MESKDEYIKILESQVRVQKAIVAKLKKKYNHVDNIIEDPTGQICDIVSNETPIQSPDADNTERGGRPSIKDYFPESFGVMDILPIYESQPELFNYAKALDRYIDDIENPTPPTLLNELRENADKRAIEFAEWIYSEFWILSSDDLWYQKSDGNIYSGISTAELLKQFHNRPL